MSGRFPACPVCGKPVTRTIRDFRTNISPIAAEASEAKWWVTLWHCDCGHKFGPVDANEEGEQPEPRPA